MIPKSYQQLRERFHRERPRRVWVSARCTYWCPWTALNYQTEDRRAQLEKYLRRERAMFRLLIPFPLEMLQLYPETELFWEWPTRCYGWQEQWLLYLSDELLKLDREWLFARVDGGRYDLKSQREVHLQKRWTIGTTSNTFFQFFRNKLALAVMVTITYKVWKHLEVHISHGSCAAPLHSAGAMNYIHSDGLSACIHL
jgi:hypothetical protein